MSRRFMNGEPNALQLADFNAAFTPGYMYVARIQVESTCIHLYPLVRDILLSGYMYLDVSKKNSRILTNFITDMNIRKNCRLA